MKIEVAPIFLTISIDILQNLKNKKIMDREEFQKKYDNSILVCCTENSIKKVFNICDLMDLTVSKSKQITAILIGEQTAKSPLFHVEQFLSDFYKGIEEGERKEIKMFEQRMNNAIYKLNQKYGDTYIIKGINMDTVIKCITEIGMNVNLETADDVIRIIGEGNVMPCTRYSVRQLIADVMANMIEVLDSFINRKVMIDVDNTYQKQEILNEICFYIRNITAMQIYQGKDKDTLTISLCLGVERIRLNDDELDVFRKAFRILHECNEWIKEDDERNKKERPTFNKGSRIMYTIEDENGNTHTVTRLSKRCYELKECKTLFVTDDEGVVTGIYKEK
nr:MAG TPA: hypothetical protein [Caudoviricetes sp.]